MPNVMSVLRAEIRRLARKEMKQETAVLKKHVATMRRRLAESRTRIRDLELRAQQAGRSVVGSVVASAGDKQVRFSAAWVRAHRMKLGMSREIYARLVGVSAQTIMAWETARSRPRLGALRTWRSIREKGIRELREMLGRGTGPKRGGKARATRSRRRVRRRIVRRRRVKARSVSGRKVVRRRVKARKVPGRKIVRRRVRRPIVRSRVQPRRKKK